MASSRSVLLVLLLALAGAAAAQAQSAGAFRDCADCPEMVAVPAGTGILGSPPDDPGRGAGELPAHAVRIGRALAVGRFEVTAGEWARCAAAGACSALADGDPDGHSDGGRQPAVRVTWQAARGYARWLAAVTGRPYRLPTEAEWEYAARAGSDRQSYPRVFTRVIQGCYLTAGQGRRPEVPCRTSTEADPVGSFPANAFGLHDMLGNAAEWVADCWRPGDGGTPPDCSLRVLRGSTLNAYATELRPAARTGVPAGFRDRLAGFRVVRAME